MMKKPSALLEFTVIQPEDYGIYIRYRDRWLEVYVTQTQNVFTLAEGDEEFIPYTILATPIGD